MKLWRIKIKILSDGLFNAVITSILILLILPSKVVAQNQYGSSRMDVLLEEVIVTARKREESLQDTPVAVSAYTSEALEIRGITDIDELQSISPNLTFNTSSAFMANSATVFLRGVGQADFAPTTEPGVGIYVDGVYYGRTVGSVLNIIDFERVEVLRGPQGTLFGRNTIGGAINITTEKPSEDFQFRAEVTTGTDDRLDIKGTMSGQILENVYGKFTMATFNQDGFIKHDITGQDFGDEDEVAGRAALRWEPNDEVEFNLAFDYSRDRENGHSSVFGGAVYLSPFGFDGIPGTGDDGAPNFPFVNNVFLGAVPPQFGGTGCDGSFANPAGSIDNPGCVNDQFLGKNSGEGASYSKVDTHGVSLNIAWSPADWIDINSITSFRNLNAHTVRDSDLTPLFLISRIEDIFEQDQWTQEIQFQGRAFEESLEWILGFYYFQEEGINPNPVEFQPVAMTSGGDYDNKSIAGFAQGTYHITDRLHLTAGIRYSKDTKQFLPKQIITESRNTLPPAIGGVGARPLPFVEKTVKADDWTPHLSLSFDATNDLMVYVSYTEGFKGGGFHQRVFPSFVPGITCPPDPLECIPTFEPEFVTNYEVGFKYSGLDGKFRLNGAGFYADYDDLQITVLSGIAPVLDNAGKATLAGFELESQWVPADGWYLEAAAGYIDASYDEVDPSTGLNGDEAFAWVPRWTIGASIAREIQLGDNGSIIPRIDWSWRDKTWFDAANTLDSFQDDYHLVNASIAWESVNGKYGVTFGAKNIGNKEYLKMRRIQIPFGNFENLLGRDFEWYLKFKYSYSG